MLKLKIALLCLVLALAPSTAVARTHAEILAEDLRNPDGPIMVIAHRACWANAPENSISAIEACVALGVDMVELDVRRTADDQLVLMHDETLERMTNGAGPIKAQSLAALRRLRLREREGGPGAPLTQERVTTFREALEAARGRILINVDAKEDVFADAAAMIRELGMNGQVLMKHDAAPEDPQLREIAHLGFAFFMPVIYEQTDSPALSDLVERYAPLAPRSYEIVFSHESWLTEGVPAIERHNARVWVNTLAPYHAAGHVDGEALADPDAHWGRVIELGANMIQTDEPGALISYLRNTGRRN